MKVWYDILFVLISAWSIASIMIIIALVSENTSLRLNVSITNELNALNSFRSVYWELQTDIFINTSNFWKNQTYYYISEVDYWQNRYLDAKNHARDYEVIASMVAANRTYNKDTYNCVNFSQDLIAAYKAIGYNARPATGYCDANGYIGGHEWVILELELPVEATTGNVIPPDEYKAHYTEGFVG